MKIINYFLSLLCACSLVFLISCGKDDDPDKKEKLTDQQKAAKALSDGSPWQVTTVVSKPNPDIDETPLMSLQLSFGVTGSETTIAPGSFTSSSDDFFSADTNATWAWSEDGTSSITLSGVSVSELTDIQFNPDTEDPSSITLSFVLTDEGGRAKGLGEYTVILE